MFLAGFDLFFRYFDNKNINFFVLNKNVKNAQQKHNTSLKLIYVRLPWGRAAMGPVDPLHLGAGRQSPVDLLHLFVGLGRGARGPSRGPCGKSWVFRRRDRHLRVFY